MSRGSALWDARRTGIAPEYECWRSMIKRCHNPRGKDFPHYGGRGISVCDRWRNSYANFLSDMGRRPSSLHSIERKNNDAGYSPDNCRWATREQQDYNKQDTVRVEFKGEILSTKELAERTGVNQITLRWRLKQGWPVDRASAPARRKVSSIANPEGVEVSA